METQQAGRSTRSGWVVVALAVVAGVVLGAIAVIVFWPNDSGAEAVTLERAEQPGDDPFTESVQTGEVPVIEQPAVEAASAVRADLPQDDTTSVLVATGTAPGLYGGSGDVRVCDAAKLVGYLNEHADKAAAFSEVLGITPEGIGDYVASLTPVVLMSDTLVTNHGFQDGRATALTSVLQSGTAVMVDAQGVPRVKCNCGNPLTPPQVVPTADWDVRGDAWDGFDEASVTGIVAGDTVTEFTLCDLVTGRTFTRPVGATLTDVTPAPTTTSTSTTSTTVAPPPTGPIAGSGGPCDPDTLEAVVRGNISSPVQYFSVSLCNERWALGGVTYEEQDDPWLLEWNGSAWVTGACQKYRDPNDFMKSPVVPEEYWIACIVD